MIIMNLNVRRELKLLYNRAVFGGLILYDVPNKKENEKLENLKRELEKEIREEYPDVVKDQVIRSYDTYYKKWGKTYPIQFQIKTIKGGSRFPRVSALVDSMFLSELRNRILTSAHDFDSIQGELWYDVSDEGEKYTKINGKEQMLPRSDIVLRDSDGILASVLYGPARRTSINNDTENALYLAWCPYSPGVDVIEEHLRDIISNLEVVYGHFKYETRILE
jgi:DNA/RNA-binding domain of Phe-tRNA-synthetase-like protein